MKEKTEKAACVQKTREQLSQYKRLVREIRDDRLRLAQLHAQLEREGSGAGLPDLFGFTSEDLAAYRRYIDENLARCLTLVVTLQGYMNNIEDSETRRLFIWRYIYGYSWQRVAFAMGWHDESLPRKKHDRYLARHSLPLTPQADPRAVTQIPDIDAALRREALENGR